MKDGLNEIPGETLVSLAIRDDEFTLEVDPAWAGKNEILGQDIPVDGFIRYSIVRGHQLGDYMEMRSVFVQKGKRKQGIGRRLFEKIETIARQENIKRIVVMCWCAEKDDVNAFCHFLPRMGYTRLPKTEHDFDWEKYV